MNLKVDQEFAEFIRSLFEKTRLSGNSITSITDKKNLIEFRKAFTHKSFDENFNYEAYEFKGDAVVGLCVTQYIRERFPNVSSVKWITRIKHNLVSSQSLSSMAIKEGFEKHILIKGNLEKLFKDQKIRKNNAYFSVMEDVFEAFIGALVTIINSKHPYGTAYSVAYSFISYVLDKREISLKIKDVFDPKSRIKELYDSLGWSFADNVKNIRGGKTSPYTTILYGFPEPGESKGSIEISRMSSGSDKHSQNVAYTKALSFLYNKGIKEPMNSPYILEKEDETVLPIIPEGFHEFVENILKRIGIKPETREIFLTKKSLHDLRMSLVHASYDKYMNNNMYKFEGNSIMDLIIVDFLNLKFPNIKSEKWLTNIKHNITSGNTFYNISKKLGLLEYSLCGDNLKEIRKDEGNFVSCKDTKNVTESLVRPFVAALLNIADSEILRGVGYFIVFSLLFPLLSEENISVKFENVFDHKSRLKELFQKQGWNFEQNLMYEEEEGSVIVAKIFGFPLGNRKPFPNNRTLISSGKGRSKIEAAKGASKNALEILKTQYKIKENFQAFEN